ncbi:MAG: hypothetical protein EA424_04065, partial [Planctomycetaceae bacterium]
MSKPYDATIKDLAAEGPADFVSWFDGPTTLAVTLLNVDLSTVTTAADVVFGIGDPLTEILHLDAQAGPSATKHLDVLAYNVLLHRRYRVPVRSIVLLLRSSLATAPLAVLGKLPETIGLTDGLAAVVRQLAERLEREAAGDQADRLLVAAYVLTGLRLKASSEVQQLFQ